LISFLLWHETAINYIKTNASHRAGATSGVIFEECAMFRKLVCAMFVMTVGIGLVAAEEFQASITKVDAEGGKVTIQKMKKGEKKFGLEKDGDPVTLPVAKDAKITKSKFNFDKDNKKVSWDPDGAIEGGLKNDIFKIEEKKKDETKDKDTPKDKGKGKGKGFGGFGGLNAQITTSEDGKTITAIDVRQFGGFGKKGKNKTDK
jgi:hypothetical protein